MSIVAVHASLGITVSYGDTLTKVCVCSPDCYCRAGVYMYAPRKIEDRACGHGLGGVCDHINHLSYHIKGKLVWKA